MIILGADSLTLSFGERDVLKNVSFSVQEGERVGVVGENGAGKTSLFRVLTGEYEARGNVYIAKEKTLGILEQTDAICHGKTVYEELEGAFSDLIMRENELSELHLSIEEYEKGGEAAPEELINRYSRQLDSFTSDGGNTFRGRVKSYLIKLGFPEDSWELPSEKLSGGQKTRLALGRLLLNPPDILLLDEPTNHLDIQTLDWLQSVVCGMKSTVIVVSHDRYFLDRTVTKILDIENGTVKLYSGNYSAYVTQKKNDREIQRRHYENQQREIARMEAFIEQQHRWNRERNIIAAESRQKAIDRIVKLEAPTAESRGVKLVFQSGTESGNDVLTVKGLKKSFGGDDALFSDVSFLIKRGERAFIYGKNGCGKSTLMKILRGRLAQSGGTFEFGYNVNIGYYDQENQELDDENTVLDELWNAFPRLSRTEIQNALAQFEFCGDDVMKKVSMLSGGEKARLTLTKLILRPKNVLLLDEPTNHLDIRSREALEEALENYTGTIIAVSHDRYFISKLCTRVLDLSAEPFFDYKGTYEDYLRYTADTAIAEQKQRGASPSAGRESYEREKRYGAEKRKLSTKIAREKEEAARIEARLDRIEIEYKENELDYKKLMELDAERAGLEEALLTLYGQTDADEKEYSQKYEG